MFFQSRAAEFQDMSGMDFSGRWAHKLACRKLRYQVEVGRRNGRCYLSESIARVRKKVATLKRVASVRNYSSPRRPRCGLRGRYFGLQSGQGETAPVVSAAGAVAPDGTIHSPTVS